MTCENETLSTSVINVAITIAFVLAIVSTLLVARASEAKHRGAAIAAGALTLVLVLGGIAIWTAASAYDDNVHSSTADNICQAYGIDAQPQIRNDIAETVKQGGGLLEREDVFVRAPDRFSAYFQLTDVVCDIAVEKHPGRSFLYTRNIVRITMHENTPEGDLVAMKPTAGE